MFVHQGNTVTISGIRIPMDVFIVLEPSYPHARAGVTLRYDGKRRYYKDDSRTWIIDGSWSDGDRYIKRVKDFVRLMADARRSAKEDSEAKYASEGMTDVKLHNRGDLNEGGTEGVRPKSKRAPRSRSKHNGGAT